MTTHDVLAYAVAGETVKNMRRGDPSWSAIFSANVSVTTSQTWPQPDFVINDGSSQLALAAEFKPPAQTKREYLTGLGQAMAYTRDFAYSALVIPDYANDGYPIGVHIGSILAMDDYRGAPIALLTYDPALLSPTAAQCAVTRPLVPRITQLPAARALPDSFYAKWREASPDELGKFLGHLYDEGRVTGGPGTIRDRAFDRLWLEMTGGHTLSLAGVGRRLTDTPKLKTGWGKNFRNFPTHIGWMLGDGALTDEGLQALHVVHRYGAGSRVFLDLLTRAVLVEGKHLVLLHAIQHFQNQASPAQLNDETLHLAGLETYLETAGLLKRNVRRHAVAVQGVPRGFLKAEKTLWRNLELATPSGPRGGRMFHSGRGFIFDWERITSLL